MSKGDKAAGGGIYGLGFLGALVFYLSIADSFGQVMYGIFKAIFWPAFMVYHLFGHLLT